MVRDRDDPPQCRIAECEQPLAKRTRGEYCDDHTCEYEDCGEKKDDREQGRYCDEHGCNMSFCMCPALDGEDFCDYCTGELCHISGCHRAKQAPGKGDYCMDHTCYKNSCYKPKRTIDHPRELYCVEHSCRALPDCNKEPAVVGGFCNEHECGIPGCHTRKKDGFTYCADHKCHSNWDDCEESVLQIEGLFCDEHTCQSSDEGCFEERASDYYCDVHSCEIPGCDGEAPHSWTQFCDRHCCNWEFKCKKQRVKEDHCEDHGCVSCSKIVYKNARVCEEHKCKESRCKKKRASDGEYCEEHTCKKSGCD